MNKWTLRMRPIRRIQEAVDVSELIGEGGAVLAFPFLEKSEAKFIFWSKPVCECVDHQALLCGKEKKRVVIDEEKDMICWAPRVMSCELVPGRKGHTSLILLDKTSDEYKAVEAYFWKSFPGAAIGAAKGGHKFLTVMRVQAPQQLKEMEMVDFHLWYGPSTLEALRGILMRGFDRFMSKTAYYGKGVYFTPDISYARHYAPWLFSAIDGNVVKVVLLAKVCMGEACVGSQDMYPPPLKPGSTKHYDSTVDNLETPRHIATYTDGQAYPMYVCTFLPLKEEEEEA